MLCGDGMGRMVRGSKREGIYVYIYTYIHTSAHIADSLAVSYSRN